MHLSVEAQAGLLISFGSIPAQLCHFEARFSAAWSRMEAVLVRLCHQFLFIRHGGWLYVDDFLFRLEAKTTPTHCNLYLLFLAPLGMSIQQAQN